MKFKDILKSKTFFVIGSFAAAVIVVVIGVMALFGWMKSYTQHGAEIELPSIVGMYHPEAELILLDYNMHIKVVDSTYTRNVPLGTIVEQVPKAGNMCKPGRTIYVIVNATMERTIPVPEVRDMSLRQAEASLRSQGFTINRIIYEPSEFRGLVLDVRQDSVKTVLAGTRLPEGAVLDLVIGQGNGTEQVPVPLLVGKTLPEARTLLLESRLVVGAVNYDEPTSATDTLYYVYSQSVAHGELILEGSRINLQLSTNPNKKVEEVTEDEEDFF